MNRFKGPIEDRMPKYLDDLDEIKTEIEALGDLSPESCRKAAELARRAITLLVGVATELELLANHPEEIERLNAKSEKRGG